MEARVGFLLAAFDFAARELERHYPRMAKPDSPRDSHMAGSYPFR